MKAKVSVIVPCYNAEKDLRRCLDSLFSQTLKDLEIVIVNDGSKDQTETIIQEYQEKYGNKIVYLPLKKNQGLGNARNLGMKHASGQYIGFVDSDDYVDPAMFQTMYEEAKRTDADLVECDFIWEYPNKEREDVGQSYEVGKEMLKKVRVMACNKIYKATMLKKSKCQFAVGLKYEDILFTYQYVPYVQKVAFVRLPFYHYVQRENSLANHQTIRVREIYFVLEQVLNFYHKKKFWDTYKEELEYLCTRYILGSSYKRASKIKERKIRRFVLKEGWKFLNETFPNWKQNVYLKESGFQNLYCRRMNRFFYYHNTWIFKLRKWT